VSYAHRYHLFAIADGFCAIAWNDLGITRFQLPARSADETRQNLLKRLPNAEAAAPDVEVREVVAAATRYFAGEQTDFSSFRLDLAQQDDFFRRVYDAARRIGWGQTTTYGTLAKELGAGPAAARAVGQAMARNPVPLIIPCHRVLAAGGKVGGFSAPGGATSKVRMLELEGVRLASEPAQQLLTL
jgi:methylated-DNA-[protein]-cysteine S-methyltransferase